jgi:Zn2+/Cd2+-exporting ATPase
MEKESKTRLVRIILSAVFLCIAIFIEKNLDLGVGQLLAVYLIPYLIAGYDTLLEAVEKIVRGDFLDEDFLMSIATVGALCIGFLPGAETQFPEAVFVMLFFQVGELFEEIAEGRSRRSISGLMDIRPDIAEVERDGRILTVNPNEVKVGEIIVVKPGEKVPMDGIVIEGESSLNTVALTGESVPRSISRGDGIISGCVNLTGVIRAEVTKVFGESTATRILNLVENASESKSRSESFISRFAGIYTPVVVIAALALAFIPPVLSGDFGSTFSIWLYRALTFLIVSCPCALVISVPLSFFGGIGGASSKGILIKGSNYLEALAKVCTVVFDKTGTLTEGVFDVTAVHPEKIDANELLHLAAHVERYSLHPIAVSLKNAFPGEDDGCLVENVEEIAGHGVRASVNGRSVCVGNTRMMDMTGARWKPCENIGTVVHVSVDGVYAGHIVVSDRIKADSAEAVKSLKEEGVTRTVMLTGDKREVAEHVASAIGLNDFRAELLPSDKVVELEKLLAEKPHGKTLAFVGDGMNDAPVLARADLGIAMGGLGSDAAIEAADVVLMDDKPSKIVLGVRISRKTLRIARENTFFAIFIKLVVLGLAAAGIATMWMAVFADVGVTVLAVMNAMRALKA